MSLNNYFEKLLESLSKNENAELALKLTNLIRQKEPNFARVVDPVWGNLKETSTAEASTQSENKTENKTSYSDVVRLNNRTNQNNQIPPKEDTGDKTKSASVTFQERLQMSTNAENTWRQIRSSMTVTEKAKARITWLYEMISDRVISTWSSGEEPLPLYARTDDKLLYEIAGFRMESCLNIQAAVARHLEAKVLEDEKDTGHLLTSLENMLDDNPNCTFEQAKDKLSVLVGKETAALKHQLSKKKQFFKDNSQHSRSEFARAKFTFPKLDETVKTNPPENPPSADVSTTPSGGKKSSTDNENRAPPKNSSAKNSKKGQNGPKKDFQPPRQNRDTQSSAQNGDWNTVSRKRERSRSKDRKVYNQKGSNNKNQKFQQTQGWTLSAREKELIKAYRKN